MITEKTLILPTSRTSTDNSPTTEIKIKSSLLLIGANGSGKTRLGTWIEINSPQKREVHRISAQKSLSMLDSVVPMTIDLAKKNLLYGDILSQVAKNRAMFSYTRKRNYYY